MKIDQDCLNYSDAAFKAVLDQTAKEQEQRHRSLRREYAKHQTENYVEYQRRKGCLKWTP